MNSKFVLFQSEENNQFYFRFIDLNGRNVLRSEGYTTKQNCQKGIESVKTHAPADKNYERLKATDGRYYYNHKAENNEVIATSNFYVNVQDRKSSIYLVKSEAPSAQVVDKTKEKLYS